MAVRRRVSLPLVALLLLGSVGSVVAGGAAVADTHFPPLTVVNVAADGTKADVGTCGTSAVSADGRFVAFCSDASNLVVGDSNGAPDVFVKDRTTGAIEIVSTAADGALGNNGVLGSRLAMSADGRLVAFSSHASNLVPGDSAGSLDVFVKDRFTSAIERVSVASNGDASANAYATSEGQAMSSDGRFVGFWSTAADLAPGAEGGFNFYVRDRVDHTTTLIRHSNLNQIGWAGSISDNGRYVTLQGGSTTNANDTSPHLYDRVTGTRTRIADSGLACISGDGSTIVVETTDPLDPAGDANQYLGFRFRSLYVVDRATGSAQLANVDSGGTPIFGDAVIGGCQALSNDGSVVAFSVATDNSASPLENGWQPFVRDLASGATRRLTPALPPGDSRASGLDPAVSADGTTAVFRGWGDQLIPGYTTYRGEVLMEDVFAVLLQDLPAFVMPPSDGDGISASTENLAPNNGDGNGDGVLDSVQSNVASLPNATSGEHITLESPEHTSLMNVQAIDPSSVAPPPPTGTSLPAGLVTFELHLAAGQTAADVRVFLPSGTGPNGYLKFSDTWIDFSENVTIAGDVVTLHLVDGGAGDSDNTVNAVIVDPGAAAVGYRFEGFRPPIDTNKVNLANPGQTIPAKWRITTASGAPISDPSAIVSITSTGTACTGGQADEIEAYATGTPGLQYLGNGEWKFNWKTAKTWSGQCRTLRLNLDDGFTHTAAFKFK